MQSSPGGIQETPLIWIHAASVGEVFTVLPLLKTISATLLVTTTTPSGAAVLQQQALPNVQHQYLPIDFPGACRRFFKTNRIKEGWILETEIWPWLFATAKSHRIPLSIVNARLTDKTSAHAKGLLARTYQQALSDVRVLARTKVDAEKFIQLGALPMSTSIVGNLKYANSAADNDNNDLQRLIEKPYFLAASTHDDEERQLAVEWCRQQRQTISNVALVIVPRHPERGAIIHRQLKAKGINAVQRSHNQPMHADDIIYIADTLGELNAWYQHAIAGFIGGSLIERGGHNILEAARLGCPIVVGPHTFNFDDIVQTLTEHDALAIAHNAQQVIAFFNKIIENQSPYAAMALRARNQAQICENVLDNYLRLLLPESP